MAGAIESICIGPMSEEALEELVERVVPVSLSVAKEDHLLWSGATRDFDVSIARESILDHLEARALPRELRFSLNVVFSYPRDHGGRAGRAAAGAPADLLARAHRAALEEIEHAERCFALAAGYGGRTRSVEPMPDLLLGGLG